MPQRAGAQEHTLNSPKYAPVYRVKRHLTEFLQWQFSKNPDGAYRFVQNEDGSIATESQIFIGGDTPIDPEMIGQRPAITFTRGSQSYAGMSLNDIGYTDMRNGLQIRMDLTPVTMVMNVLGTTDMEAEALAHFATKRIWAMRDEIIRTEPAIHLIGHEPQVGAPSPADALVQGSPGLEWVAVVVNFPCYLVDSATKQPLNKRLHKGTTVTIIPKN